MTSSTLLSQILDPIQKAMSQRVARAILKLRADDTAQARIDELAEKNKEGLLSSAERSEYEAYVSAANLIAILQAQARATISKIRRVS